jgi:hypothetical protein
VVTIGHQVDGHDFMTFRAANLQHVGRVRPPKVTNMLVDFRGLRVLRRPLG